MVAGFILTLTAFFKRIIFDWWLFRTLHLVGILYVSLLAAMGRFCPLTIFENELRSKQDPEQVYSGAFIVHYVEKIVYPEVAPMVVLIPTFLIAIVTLIVYLIYPPEQVKRLFRTQYPIGP